MGKRLTRAATQQDKAFPIAIVSRVPRRVGLEYGMTVTGEPIPAPSLPMLIHSSDAQQLSIHRFQESKNIRLIRPYGFRPDYPTPRTQSIKPMNSTRTQRPLPTMSSVPASAARGSMGSPRRFPKATKPTPNTWKVPTYQDNETNG